MLEVTYLTGLIHGKAELRVCEEKKSFKVYLPDSATFYLCFMVQYGTDGKVIPHYWGENYRGFDIFKTYYLHRGNLYECWMGRDPYNDKDLFTCNLLKAPVRHRFKTREQICEWIDKYTFLAQPDQDETSRLSGSIWDYEWDERDQCWIYPI